MVIGCIKELARAYPYYAIPSIVWALESTSELPLGALLRLLNVTNSICYMLAGVKDPTATSASKPLIQGSSQTSTPENGNNNQLQQSKTRIKRPKVLQLKKSKQYYEHKSLKNQFFDFHQLLYYPVLKLLLSHVNKSVKTTIDMKVGDMDECDEHLKIIPKIAQLDITTASKSVKSRPAMDEFDTMLPTKAIILLTTITKCSLNSPEFLTFLQNTLRVCVALKDIENLSLQRLSLDSILACLLLWKDYRHWYDSLSGDEVESYGTRLNKM